jgi:hypothetical protein
MHFELTLVRRKDKQAQMMVADLSPSIEIVVLTFRLSISIIAMHILLSRPDDTATLLLSFQQRTRKNIPDR